MSKMIYPEEFELKVGFDRIRNRIHDSCLSQQGREKAFNIGFTADRSEIITKIDQTAEFQKILE
ncbi:MAG: hypothetical protein ACLFN1_06520, partial [Bacteroidales bacterium]